ncbi:MAG TPA: type II toxin-antitoxin system RelE/ParE family toxin [Vicinamibacteria bacterium]|nr:type II toxin-antitoxin system RelE/ParE family toxin [Vicinamibacteria bacterium]
MVEVVYTDEFEAWWDGLSEGEQEDVGAVVDALAERGVRLRFPLTSAIKGSKVALRELRIQSGGHPLRVFYVFDPKRQAVLLIGGDKAGRDRFYEEIIPRAEAIFEAYLREGKEEGAKRGK